MSCLPTLGPLLTPLNIHSKLGELTWELTAYAYEGVSKMDGLSTSLGTGGNDLMELEDTDAPQAWLTIHTPASPASNSMPPAYFVWTSLILHVQHKPAMLNDLGGATTFGPTKWRLLMVIENH